MGVFKCVRPRLRTFTASVDFTVVPRTGHRPMTTTCETALASAGRISVWPGWRRRKIEAFCLQLVLHFLNRAIKLLIFAFEFFSGIVVHHDVRINSVAFDDPLFAVLGVKRELRFEKLSAVDKRQRFANASDPAPSPFADELAESKRFESVTEN